MNWGEFIEFMEHAGKAGAAPRVRAIVKEMAIGVAPPPPIVPDKLALSIVTPLDVIDSGPPRWKSPAAWVAIHRMEIGPRAPGRDSVPVQYR